MRNFKTLQEKQIYDYLNSISFPGFYKYKNNTKSWIFDQKVTYDLINVNCKSILHFYKQTKQEWFTWQDLLKSDATINFFNFKKQQIGAALFSEKTLKEFDKLIWNSLESLSYTEILEKRVINNKKKQYKIKEIEILDILSSNELACISYVCVCALKLLECSGLKEDFEKISKNFSKNLFDNIKQKFYDWFKSSTRHNGDVTQISNKIFNPLFYIYNLPKYAADKRARKLKMEQSTNDLIYFRLHRRDYNRPQFYTRKEAKIFNQTKNRSRLSEPKQKEHIKKWNQQYFKLPSNSYKSEISGQILCSGCYAHHIQPKSEFYKNDIDPNIFENFILVSADEHLGFCHLNGNTTKINVKNLEEVLLKQLKKIIDFSKMKIGEYNLEKFYYLICYIKKIKPREDFKKNEDEILIGYIENIISF